MIIYLIYKWDNMLIINSCGNAVFFAMLHIRIHLYDKGIINFISSFNAYYFNPFTLILTENIKTNTIKRHVNNTFNSFFQKTILCLCHLAFKDRILYSLPIIYTSLGYTP